MTDIEERLRNELPELAEALMSVPAANRSESAAAAAPAVSRAKPGMDGRGRPTKRVTQRRRQVLASAACLVAIVAIGIAVGLNQRSESTVDVATAAKPPIDFGTWEPLPPGPLEPRAYAVTAWTGDEIIFWAGSNLERNFAYTDGAAFDPAAGAWSELAVPGWGHPGLSADIFDGEIFALAKGGGTRFDVEAGQWQDLPAVEGMFLAATVATDEALWGLGPAGQNPFGQPDLAIARYEPGADSWTYGPNFEANDTQSAIVAGLASLTTTTHWTGTEIVIWAGAHGGIAYDPATEQWRSITPPVPPSGVVVSSVATMTNRGLTVLADIEGGDPVDAATAEGGKGNVRIALLDDGDWTWLATRMPLQRFETLTLIGAEDWMVLFAADQPAITVHMPTGDWRSHDAGPLGGVQGVNAAWTGDSVIAWGGVPSNPDRPAGAIWTPPVS